jgi:hypothetical protein
VTIKGDLTAQSEVGVAKTQVTARAHACRCGEGRRRARVCHADGMKTRDALVLRSREDKRILFVYKHKTKKKLPAPSAGPYLGVDGVNFTNVGL